MREPLGSMQICALLWARHPKGSKGVSPFTLREGQLCAGADLLGTQPVEVSTYAEIELYKWGL